MQHGSSWAVTLKIKLEVNDSFNWSREKIFVYNDGKRDKAVLLLRWNAPGEDIRAANSAAVHLNYYRLHKNYVVEEKRV